MGELMLWGAGGHGKVVLDIARAMGEFETIFFIVDRRGDGELCGCRVLEADRYFESLHEQSSCGYVVSIGENRVRAACFQRALDEGLTPVTLIHPSALVSESAKIGNGTVVMPRVAINASAEIGKNCILNTGAVIEHDCRVGDHAHLSPGVLLGGRVTVHSFAHVGIGAIILPGAEIGEGAVVGAGSVVLGSVPPGTTVVGNPARALVKMGRFASVQ